MLNKRLTQTILGTLTIGNILLLFVSSSIGMTAVLVANAILLGVSTTTAK